MSPGPDDFETAPQIIIVSFGYLHGEPPEGAHITLDLRAHFRDPHVSPALRDLTCHDQDVRTAVLDTTGIIPLIEATAAQVRAYASGPSVEENDVVIAIGCAGGRHRSATVATELRDLLDMDGYDVTLIHRDLDKPVVARNAEPVINSADSVALDAGAYEYLANVLRETMADPDYWDGEEAESWILGQYVYWLAAGKPYDEDGVPDRSAIGR